MQKNNKEHTDTLSGSIKAFADSLMSLSKKDRKLLYESINEIGGIKIFKDGKATKNIKPLNFYKIKNFNHWYTTQKFKVTDDNKEYDTSHSFEEFHDLPFGMKIGVFRKYFNSIGISFCCSWEPKHNGFSIIAFDRINPGSHDSYHVIENSLCRAKYYKTEEEAQIKAIELINEYLTKINSDG